MDAWRLYHLKSAAWIFDPKTSLNVFRLNAFQKYTNFQAKENYNFAIAVHLKFKFHCQLYPELVELLCNAKMMKILKIITKRSNDKTITLNPEIKNVKLSR